MIVETFNEVEIRWPGVALKDTDPLRAKARVESYTRRQVTLLLLRQKKVTKEKATLPYPNSRSLNPPGGRRRNSARLFDIQGERASNICVADPPGRPRLRRGWKGESTQGAMMNQRLTI